MNATSLSHVDAESEARRAMCSAALDALISADSGVRAATLSSVDGLEIASAGAIPLADAGKLAAITSSLQALGVAVASELDLGSLESVSIEAGGGRMLCIEIALQDKTLILAAVAAKKALLALTLISTRHCAQRIATQWMDCSKRATGTAHFSP